MPRRDAPKSVRITLRAVVTERDVRFFHTCTGAPAGEKIGLFRVPRRGLKPGAAEEIVAHLAPWIIERFRLEAEVAVRAVERAAEQ